MWFLSHNTREGIGRCIVIPGIVGKFNSLGRGNAKQSPREQIVQPFLFRKVFEIEGVFMAIGNWGVLGRNLVMQHERRGGIWGAPPPSKMFGDAFRGSMCAPRFFMSFCFRTPILSRSSSRGSAGFVYSRTSILHRSCPRCNFDNTISRFHHFGNVAQKGRAQSKGNCKSFGSIAVSLGNGSPSNGDSIGLEMARNSDGHSLEPMVWTNVKKVGFHLCAGKSFANNIVISWDGVFRSRTLAPRSLILAILQAFCGTL